MNTLNTHRSSIVAINRFAKKLISTLIMSATLFTVGSGYAAEKSEHLTAA